MAAPDDHGPLEDTATKVELALSREKAHQRVVEDGFYDFEDALKTPREPRR